MPPAVPQPLLRPTALASNSLTRGSGSPPATVESLRKLLAGRFPQATRITGTPLPTGVPSLDEATGGLPRHALTELVCTAPGVGGHLFLAQLLASTRALPARVALIDASDQFDPQSLPADELAHLVWIRCRTIGDAMPVADILAREANFDLVILDFVQSPLPGLKRIPATTWYRIQRAVEQTDLAFLVLTSAAAVPSAQLRIQLDRPHNLASHQLPRPHLAIDLDVSLQRQRQAAM